MLDAGTLKPPALLPPLPRARVPELTVTLPLLVKGTLIVLAPVLLKVPWLLKESVPLLTEKTSAVRFQVAPGSLMTAAFCI